MMTGVIVLLIIGYLITCIICSVMLGMMDFANSLSAGMFHNHPPTLRGIAKFLISPLIVLLGAVISKREKTLKSK